MKSNNIPRPYFEIYYTCLSTLLALLYTYPLILKPSEMFYGFPWDSLGGIWFFWWGKFSYLHGLPMRIHSYLAYPFGQDFSQAPFSYLSGFLGIVLTFIANEVVAYNILKLISFSLLALTTYLLLYYLTNDKLSSTLLGLSFSFSPFHVIHNMAHFANAYWVPLTILLLLKLLQEGGYKNAALFGLFWGFAFVDNAYYAYFVGLLIPVFIANNLLDKTKRAKLLQISFLKASLISILTFCLSVFPVLYPIFKSIFFSQGRQPLHYGLIRDFSDLFIFSAKPLDYFLPSKHNPFLGWLIPDFGIGPFKGHRYTEHTLYLGYSLIFLGGYALYCAVKRVGQLGGDKKERQTIYLFSIIILVAIILSAPPFIPLGNFQVNLQTREVIAKHKLYLPQYFLFKLFPMFRVYARMGIMALLGIVVLASFGLKEILYRIGPKKKKYLFITLVSLVFFLEYAEFPSFRLSKVQEPAVYKWLASRPGEFPIVEYPLGAGDDSYTTYEYIFYQRLHAKYLVNGAIIGTPADEFRKEVVDISKRESIRKLQKIGVKYILIHRNKYLKGNEYVPLDWLTKPPRDKIFPIEYNNGKLPDLSQVKDRLRVVKDFGDTVVYKIIL